LCPGCPPRFLPFGFFATRDTPGPSDDGGFDEFVEFSPSRASRSRTRSRSSTVVRSSTSIAVRVAGESTSPLASNCSIMLMSHNM
jgi:hypothetical protein